MTKALTPDLCVIGAGVGGHALAAGAAAAGASVVAIEKEAVNGAAGRSDLALMAFCAAAGAAHAMRRASRFGIADAEPEIDYRALRRQARASVEATAPNRGTARLGAMGVLVLNAQGRFKDRRTVVAGETEIRARHFVVAAGSTALAPAIPGIETVDWLDYGAALDLPRRPGRPVIVGGAPAGLELAQAFGRLGSPATVVVAGSMLEHEDPELAAILLRQLRAEGLEIREHARIERVERRGKTGIRLFAANEAGGEDAIDGTHLLAAAGRQPAVDGLDLDKAGIAFSKDGIAVDAGFRTSNRRVFAIGAVTGRSWPAGPTAHQAQRVLRQILAGEKTPAEPMAVPRLTLSDPELAHIGLTEAEARASNARIRVLRWPYDENERAQAERCTAGFVKLVADRNERILGVSIVGAHAGELIGVWALALSRGLTVRDMTDYVPAHPTIGEIGKSAAISYFSAKTRRKGVRGLLRLLRLTN